MNTFVCVNFECKAHLFESYFADHIKFCDLCKEELMKTQTPTKIPENKHWV